MGVATIVYKFVLKRAIKPARLSFQVRLFITLLIDIIYIDYRGGSRASNKGVLNLNLCENFWPHPFYETTPT